MQEFQLEADAVQGGGLGNLGSEGTSESEDAFDSLSGLELGSLEHKLK